MLPLALCFTGFFAANGVGTYSKKVPVAVIIFLTGTILWWCGLARHDGGGRELNERDKMSDVVNKAWTNYAFKNRMAPFVVFEGFADLTMRAVAIQLPIALASFVETIENVEAAHIS